MGERGRKVGRRDKGGEKRGGKRKCTKPR